MSPIEKSIFESSFRGFSISRIKERSLRQAHVLHDDFFAHFYYEISLIIINNPEAFGLVRDVIRIRRPMGRLNPAETEVRSLLGIITSNHLPLLPEGLVLRRYTLGEVRDAENRLSLLTELYGDGVGVVSLLIQICRTLLTFMKKCQLDLLAQKQLNMERLTAQFISPNPNPRPFPDQILMSTDSLFFWKLGGRVYTNPADMNVIFANWFQTNVFSYEKYVKFANPLLLLASSERS